MSDPTQAMHVMCCYNLLCGCDIGGKAIIVQVLIGVSCGAGYRMQLVAQFALVKVALEQDPT